MATVLMANIPVVMEGLGTFTHTVVNSSLRYFKGEVTAPLASSLSIVINQNGTPVYTAPAFTPTQTALQFRFDFLPTAADLMTIVLSSSAPVDNQANVIKSIVSTGLGE